MICDQGGSEEYIFVVECKVQIYSMVEVDNSYIMIQMDEKKFINVCYDLEEFFNEEFWLKVR